MLSQPQDSVIAREAPDAEHGMERRIKAQPIAVSETRGPDNDGDEEGAKRIGQRDGVGRGIAERHGLGDALVEANPSQPSDETGETSEGRDGLGGGGKFDLAQAGKLGKIHVIVLCGGRSLGCGHKLPSHRSRRAKRLFPKVAFGLNGPPL